MIFNRLTVVTAILAALLLSACNDQEPMGDDRSLTEQEASQRTTRDDDSRMSPAGEERAGQSTASSAVAMLEPTQGNEASGTVRFTAVDRGVRLKADISGLSAGQHGFYVHAKGDCSAPDASSAGGHFNPHGVKHGAPGGETHHVGDLGNIEANDQGRATLEQDFEFLSLTGDDSIVGKAMVVHSGPDDFESQPSGDDGSREACGVIRVETT